MGTWLSKCAGAILSLSAMPALGVTIAYQSTDLPDLVSGQDRWSYAYRVTGDFAAFEGFNVLFSPAEYADLQGMVPDPPDWLTLTIEPDVGLGTEGLLTASALADVRAVNTTFEIEFAWLGAGSPGAQRVEFFDTFFSISATGSTTAESGGSVPEPGSLLLVSAALGVMGWRLRRR